MDRRDFVSALAGAAALPAMANVRPPSFTPEAFRRMLDASRVAASRGEALHRQLGRVPSDAVTDAALAADEDFWEPVQRAFDLDRTWINLNNGGCSPAPSHVMEGMIRDLRWGNELPMIHMTRTLESRVESVRRELAREFGCDAEEVAITRNTTESLETLIFGIELKAGDEVIVTNQNYPRMLNAWRQRERRDGIVVKAVSFTVPFTSPAQILERVEAAITPRTKVLEFPHVTNLTGQVLPVKELVALGRRHNVETFVDGAHAFAHFPFTRDELDCDYYGASLHKWMLAPVGTGLLYVRKNRQKRIWPLMAAMPEEDDNIRKFEQIGTHPAANHNAIAVSIAFHRALGPSRKFARLVYLRDRWAKRLLAEGKGRVRILSPMDSRWGGAIGFLSVDGLDHVKLGGWLEGQHRIAQTPTTHPEFTGIRITPNVYTTLDEIDRFSDLVLRAISTGIS